MAATDSSDTTQEAVTAQRAVFRQMEPARRLALACEMSDELRAVAEAGAAHRARVVRLRLDDARPSPPDTT